jgi:hypothetical protein
MVIQLKLRVMEKEGSIMAQHKGLDAAWHKASASNGSGGNNCVEARITHASVAGKSATVRIHPARFFLLRKTNGKLSCKALTPANSTCRNTCSRTTRPITKDTCCTGVFLYISIIRLYARSSICSVVRLHYVEKLLEKRRPEGRLFGLGLT